MSKTIRLEDDVYFALDDIRDKRETFSAVVARLMRVYVTIKDVSDTLGPGHYLRSAQSPGELAAEERLRQNPRG